MTKKDFNRNVAVQALCNWLNEQFEQSDKNWLKFAGQASVTSVQLAGGVNMSREGTVRKHEDVNSSITLLEDSVVQ